MKRIAAPSIAVLAVLGTLAACNVDSPPPSTGGLGPLPPPQDPTTANPDGGLPVSADGGPSAPVCARGVVVVTSDYVSTNVALSKLDGTTLSASFLSSAAKPAGLSTALSGDVDIPTGQPSSGRVVLLDRFGTNVLTWMDPATGNVIGQLPVGQGFESNPHDYSEVDATRAYVTRNNTNPAPGAQANDAGDDVLIIDTTARTILGRIAMPSSGNLLPRASGMLRLGKFVMVMLQRFSLDFKDVGSSVLVGVDPSTDSIAWEVELTGLQSCGRIAPSPDGASFAVACAGKYDAATNSFAAGASDVVLFDVTNGAPVEKKRLGLPVKLGTSVQSTVSFASAKSLLTSTYGNGTPSTGDQLVFVDLVTGTPSVLKTASKQFVYGGIRCAPGCGDVCLVADADTSSLLRYQIDPGTGGATELPSVKVDTAIGLPPRTIGLF